MSKKIFKKKENFSLKLGVMVCAYISSSQEAEAGG
jgi:hypothetical protein